VPHLVVPYTLDTNDMRFALPQGFSHGDPFFQYLRDSFDVHYAEGAERPRMMSIGMHCRLLGRPGTHRGAAALPGPYRHARPRVGLPPHRHRPPLEADRSPLRRLTMPLTLEQINAATPAEATALLDGLYEHSPWIAEAALAHAPVRSLAHLKQVMAQVVRDAGRERQLALIRAHPELAGKAMVSNTLTAESTHEQSKAGLTDCTPEEFARSRRSTPTTTRNSAFPFILAVRGPRGTGLSKRDIIDTFARRLDNHPDFEVAECLRNIHRIVEIRLNDKFGVEPVLGNLVWDWQEAGRSTAIPVMPRKGSSPSPT
jgi:OHCU decarboxylase